MFAWCTLVMSNDNYARGAVVLANSLRTVATKHPVWCMIDSTISIETTKILEKYFDKVVVVDIIQHKCARMRSKKQNSMYGEWIDSSFTKWNILNPRIFTQKKVILLDADMIFIENCDELFELQAPALTFSSPWALPFNAIRGIPNPYGLLKHGEVVNPDSIRRAFNGSFLGTACTVLVEPNQETYDEMMRLLHRRPVYGSSTCVSGFDEQLIAETFVDKCTIRHIHQRYNCIWGKEDVWMCGEKPKAMHWFGKEKPWHVSETGALYDDIVFWWQEVDKLLCKSPNEREWFNSAKKQQ